MLGANGGHSREPVILLLEGDASLRRLLGRVLEERGCRVRAPSDVATAKSILGNGGVDVVLADADALPDDAGTADLQDVIASRTPVVALVDAGNVDGAVRTLREGVVDCVAKPPGSDRLLEALERAAERRPSGPGAGRPAGRGDDAAAQLPGADAEHGVPVPIIGRSEAIRRTLSLVQRVAPTRSSVLVVGETGTGKELVAGAIHDLSPRSEDAFVPVVCSALPDSLLDAELFGHRKGSFTGAHADRTGLVEEADGGTLFLDEISTISSEIQVKLLRVLQEREIHRIGGGPRVSVDFRLVAATNVDLAAEVRAGRFREDLFYRLNVFPIHVPPLRRRREDIPALAEHFRQRFAAENGLRRPPRIPPATLARMQEYEWPGNVRELEHFVERALIMHAGEDTIRFEAPDLSMPELEADLLERALREHWDLDRVEREYILRVLEDVGGNRSRAAELLGIHRRTITRKMQRYGGRGGGRPRRSRRDS